jgi:glycerol-3-phosphate dehydrogenase
MTPATTTSNNLQKIQKWGREEQEVQKITTLQKNKIYCKSATATIFLK